MAAIHLSLSTYEQFSACPTDLLEEEISRMSIRLKLAMPQTEEEHRQYQMDQDKLNALKHLSQLRKGKLSTEDFKSKVELVGH
jgi:hypothetical protein